MVECMGYARIFGCKKNDQITFQPWKNKCFMFLLVPMPINSMLNILYYIQWIALINSVNSIEMHFPCEKTGSIYLQTSWHSLSIQYFSFSSVCQLRTLNRSKIHCNLLLYQLIVPIHKPVD